MRCCILKNEHLSSPFPTLSLSRLPSCSLFRKKRAFAMAAPTTATKREGPAAAANKPPPPVIGKAGRYTVFITPPSTPKPPQKSPESPKTPATPPVQAPPQQFQKPSLTSARSSAGSGFFWNAIAKVQEVHSTVDEYLADWLGLDQSKYQWALNDYYETKGMEKDVGKPKEQSGKGMSV